MAKETIEKILGELEKVSSKVRNAYETGKFPDIERDIVLSKLRNIYEFINIIQPTFSNSPNKSATAINVDAKKKIENVVETHAEIEKSGISEENITESNPPLKQVQTTEPEEKQIKKEILAEKLKSGGSFMNEALTRYVNTFDISKKLQNQPIHDISKAIGINDKFLFIKELFNNDAELYQSTINTLNKADNFNNAIQFIDTTFKWDFENPSVQHLLELIRRRHPAN